MHCEPIDSQENAVAPAGIPELPFMEFMEEVEVPAEALPAALPATEEASEARELDLEESPSDKTESLPGPEKAPEQSKEVIDATSQLSYPRLPWENEVEEQVSKESTTQDSREPSLSDSPQPIPLVAVQKKEPSSFSEIVPLTNPSELLVFKGATQPEDFQVIPPMEKEQKLDSPEILLLTSELPTAAEIVIETPSVQSLPAVASETVTELWDQSDTFEGTEQAEELGDLPASPIVEMPAILEKPLQNPSAIGPQVAAPNKNFTKPFLVKKSSLSVIKPSAKTSSRQFQAKKTYKKPVPKVRKPRNPASMFVR